MRFTKFAVLAIVAPVASAFVVPRSANVNHKIAIHQPVAPLSMALEDLESKLLGTTPEPKKAAPPAKQAPNKMAPPTKQAPKKPEPDNLAMSLSDIKYESTPPKKLVKAVKPPPKPKAVREKPPPKPKAVREKPPPKPKVVREKPPPKPKVVREKKVVVERKKVVRPPPPPKPVKPSDANTVVQGVAIGAVPLVALPAIALLAGRDFLSKTAGRRQAIQEEIAVRALEKERKNAEVDAGGLVKAVVRYVLEKVAVASIVASVPFLTHTCTVLFSFL